jgi:hypothetical protein
MRRQVQHVVLVGTQRRGQLRQPTHLQDRDLPLAAAL